MGSNQSHIFRQVMKKQVEHEALSAVVTNYATRIERASQQARNRKDPHIFRQYSSQIFQTYLQQLKKLKIPQKHIYQQNKCLKILVGGISSGKTSLINTFFGTNYDVGIGQTTKEVFLAHSTKDDDIDILIYDSPGESEAFNTSSLETVALIAQSNQIFILFNSSLKNIEHMVRTFATIKPNNTFLVRTQCDRFQSDSSRSLEEEIMEDKRLLKKWGIDQVQLYKTSALEKHSYQNQAILDKMMRTCRRYIPHNSEPQQSESTTIQLN